MKVGELKTYTHEFFRNYGDKKFQVLSNSFIDQFK